MSYRLGGGEKAEEKASLAEHRRKGLGFEDRIDTAATLGPEELVYFFRNDMLVPYRISANAEEESALAQPSAVVTRYPLLPSE